MSVTTMWRALRRAGRLSDGELGTQRQGWLDKWQPKQINPQSRRYLWLRAFAATATNHREAKTALSALADYQPIPAFRPKTLAAADVGRTYLLTGQFEQAASWLGRAVRTCRALDFPIKHTKAQVWLGQALENTKDNQGACSAYHAAIRRWGKTSASSVTLARAQRRWRALQCVAQDK